MLNPFNVSTEKTRSSSFATSIHTDQISAYLPMLNDTALKSINDAQEKTDSIIPFYGRQFENSYHFDNNKIQEATKKINENYQALVSVFASNPAKILDYFGRITHALQDFYSHSNWYELKLAGYSNGQRLLDEGYGYFPELAPLQAIGKTKIVSLESGFKDPITQWGRVDGWEVDSLSYVVSAATSQGQRIGGLMTGEVNGFLYGAGKSIPITDPVTKITYPGFDHGGLAGTISGKYLGPLAKDASTDRYHQNVLELARDQVQHEFVRMVCLINDKYGEQGLKQFSDLFIRSDQQAEFALLAQKGAFSKDTLTLAQSLNTLTDNEGNDQVIDSFFADWDPDVVPVPETHALPDAIVPYAAQINAGQFRWSSMASVRVQRKLSQTPGFVGSQIEHRLQVLDGGVWINTNLFLSDFNLQR
jgi:hypothetical protein